MIPFTVYDPGTGRIATAGRAPSVATASRQCGFGQAWLPVPSDPDHDWADPAGTTSFMDGTGTFVELPGALASRPSLPRFDKTSFAADGVDAATVSGLPDGATVSVDGAEPVPTDGELVITSAMPGTYSVVVSCWPYLDYAETLTCS